VGLSLLYSSIQWDVEPAAGHSTTAHQCDDVLASLAEELKQIIQQDERPTTNRPMLCLRYGVIIDCRSFFDGGLSKKIVGSREGGARHTIKINAGARTG